ncbi:NAD(P)H-nitrite reductase large subunit [Bradyrhizobium sp. LM6.11]
MSEPLVIVGNGMAAARLVDELAKTALGRYAVAVIGDEPRLAYNRVLLSSVLAGETGSHEIELRPADWWRNRGVTVRYGYRVTEIDTGRRELKIEGEESMEYSKLVLAIGSTPLRLNVPGADLAGVHTFRDTRDVDLLLTLAAARKRVVVVGGGLLGLEAAYGLAKAGAPVTLLHLMDRLMERQLDAPAADLLKTLVERKGIRILLNASTVRIHGESQVEGVELADGSRIEADAVIFAAGIRPNTALAKDAGIAVNRGIVVNDEMQTASPEIYALGECAEHRRHLLRPRRACLRAGARAGATSRRPVCGLSGQRGLDQSEGFRRQRVLSRRLHGRGGQREPRAHRSQARHLQEARHRRRPAHRRRADRRYRRCALVSRTDPQQRKGGGDPHGYDVRPAARASLESSLR